MKNIYNNLIVLLSITLILPYAAASQENSITELQYDVNRVLYPISLSKEKISEAKTLKDLNRLFKPSWVKEYFSVEISTSQNGVTKKAVSKNDMLTKEQKDLLKTADEEKDIFVNVSYLPDNTLKHNDPKTYDFTLKVDPKKDAQFSDGQQALKKYLKESTVDKIPANIITGYGLAAVKFTVNEEGQIEDIHVFESSKDEKVDALLVEAVCNMPIWEPAEYANGVKVKQEFALAVGNMESCVVNLLNIRRLPIEE